LKGADVAVSTIADEGIESAINQVAVTTGVTMIYGRAMRRGSMGRVFLVRPGRDACKTCLAQYAADFESTGEGSWISVSERDEDVLLHECGRPVIPGSAIDLTFVAALIARKVLDVLEDKPAQSNHCVWSRDAAPDVSGCFEKPFSAAELCFPPLAQCPTCQPAPVETIELSAVLRQAIQTEVESSPDRETGGILIGHVENRKAIVAKVTANAVSTTTRFERDIEFVQQQLDAAGRELGNRGQYIGEWHSHLQTNPVPSGQDVRSMVGIAAAPNYGTMCPAMIIAGIDSKSARMASLKAWVFPYNSMAQAVQIAFSGVTSDGALCE
jgi:integrative and conjugative element protein (TIGR02256 family)